MTSGRNTPSAAFWATVVVVGVLLYPLSFGPACWVASRTGCGSRLLPKIYGPIVTRMRMNSDGHFETFRSDASLPPRDFLNFYPSGIISRYATLFATEGWRWRASLEFAEDDRDIADALRRGRWEWCEASRR